MPNPSKFHPNLVAALEAPAPRARTAAPAAATDSKIPIIVKWRAHRTAASAMPQGISVPRYIYTLIPGSAHQSTRAEIDAAFTHCAKGGPSCRCAAVTGGLRR